MLPETVPLNSASTYILQTCWPIWGHIDRIEVKQNDPNDYPFIAGIG